MSDTSNLKNLTSNPTTEDLQKINALYNKGLISECLETVSALIARYPHSANLFNIKGVIVKNMAHLDEAIGCFQQAIILDPKYAKALTNLGNTYQALSRYESALEAYKKAIVLTPAYPEVYNNLGNCLKASGDLKGAEESFLKAIELKDDFFQARYNLGNVLAEIGESDRALSEFRQAISGNHDFPEAHVSMGNILRGQGEISASINSYRLAIELNPELINAYINLGMSLSAMEADGEAIKVYEQALRIDLNSDVTLSNMGNSLMKINDCEAAIGCFLSASRINPNNSVYLNQLGNAYRESGNIDLAIDQYKLASQVDPTNAESYYHMSQLSREKLDFDSEMSSLKKTILLDPDHVDALNDLGSVHLRNRKFSDAVSSYNKAIDINPSSNLYVNLGLALKEKGDIDGAISSFKRSLSINSENWSAQHFLDAVSGVNSARAPSKYVESLFDVYADTFEQSLVVELDYKVPTIINGLFRDRSVQKASISVLDLGCGTGLVGSAIAGFCNNLEGIDISSAMIARAEEKCLYDKLVHGDIIEHLRGSDLDFDCFICADVFVYLGDLREIFSLIKSRNCRPGTLIFSVETSEVAGFVLERSGRYSHSDKYIRRLSAEFGYTVQQITSFDLRREYSGAIPGALYILAF